MKNLISLIFIFLLFFFFSAAAKDALASEPENLAILDAYRVNKDGKTQITVDGLIKPGYTVYIYINGSFNGIANISQVYNNFANFSYKSTLLPIQNNFEVMAIPRNNIDLKYYDPFITNANTVKILDEKASTSTKQTQTTSAPILVKPNKNIYGAEKLLISGFSKNPASGVKIYIDNQLDKIIRINKNTAVEKTEFSYYSDKILSRGQHRVYGISIDDQGEESMKSNILYFSKLLPLITSTTTEIDEDIEIIKGSPTISIEKMPTSTSIFNNIKPSNNPRAKKLAFDEKPIFKNIKTNFIIFTLFIIITVFWIFLVNKELGSENQKNNDDVKNPENDKK